MHFLPSALGQVNNCNRRSLRASASIRGSDGRVAAPINLVTLLLDDVTGWPSAWPAARWTEGRGGGESRRGDRVGRGALINLHPDLRSGQAHISRLLMDRSSLFWEASSGAVSILSGVEGVIVGHGGAWGSFLTAFHRTRHRKKRQPPLVATICTQENIRGGRPQPSDVTPSRFSRTSYRGRHLGRMGVSHPPVPHTHVHTQTRTHTQPL